MSDGPRRRVPTPMVIDSAKKRLILPKKKALIVPEAPALVLPKKTSQDITTRFSGLLPDIEGLGQKIIETDLDHTQAIDVESKADDLVDWAPNALSWCSDKRFLGMRPYGKQIEALLALFEEYCVPCSDMSYLADIPVGDTIDKVTSKIGLLEFGTCPHCGYTKADGRRQGVYKDPTDLIAIIGQRSGKTILSAIGITYLIHRNAYLSAPWKVYGLSPGQVIDFTIVATTVSQSEKTLWGAVRGMLENTHWFSSYKAVCNEEGKKHGVRDTIKLGETFYWMAHKSMLIYFAANDPASLRGTTRFGAAIDELGWFADDADRVKSNGTETYAALSNACLTLRLKFQEAVKKDKGTTCPMPLMFCISSPRTMNDPIMTQYRAQSANQRCVRRLYATWEFRPDMSLKALHALGETSKPTFARDYGAQPPIADDPLFGKVHIITTAFKSVLARKPKYGPIIVPSFKGSVKELDIDQGSRTIGYVTSEISECLPPAYEALKGIGEKRLAKLGPMRALYEDLLAKPPDRRPHIMGIDLGLTTNSLGIVLGYLNATGTKFITDVVIQVAPTEKRSINIADVYDNVICPLVEKARVVAVIYDGWQSTHQIQDLARKYGALGPLNEARERNKWLKKLQDSKQLPPFLAEQYSLNVQDATMLRGRVEQGDCLFPKTEIGVMELLVNPSLNRADYPFTHLALQMATVRVKGRRLLKPVGGDDDLFRAWANAAVKALTDQTINQMLLGDGSPYQKKAATSYVALAMAGKGLRTGGNISGGTTSISGDKKSPVVLRKSVRGK